MDNNDFDMRNEDVSAVEVVEDVEKAEESVEDSCGDFIERVESDKICQETEAVADCELLEEDEVTLPIINLPPPQYEFVNDISAFCFSQQGESHIKKESPCQDRCGIKVINGSIVIVAIADGVGSCALSDYGADIAVNSSLDYLEDYFTEAMQTDGFEFNNPSCMGKVLREMMQFALSSVENKATEMEQLVYLFQSTLTVGIYDGKTLYFAHAGDDGIVALNMEGTYAMVTTRHKGDEASSVYPLQSQNTWQFGKVDNTVAFVMATDGVLDAFVRPSVEGNRVYYPFVEPVFYSAQNNINEVKVVCDDWYEYMASEKYRNSVTDDLTFAGVVNQSQIQNAKKPVFDINEWAKKSAEYEKRRKEALYPKKEEKQKPKVVLESGDVGEKNHTTSNDGKGRPTGTKYRRVEGKDSIGYRVRTLDYDVSKVESQTSEFWKKTGEALEEVAGISAGILAEGMICFGDHLGKVSKEIESRRKNRKQDNGSKHNTED